MAEERLPITVIIAARNEERNLGRCLKACGRAQRIVVVDSSSTDATPSLATEGGAEVVQFRYGGGYPKKRQWAMETLGITTPWTMLLDADEFVTSALWNEIETVIRSARACDGYLIEKRFHFLGKELRFGGFSFAAVLLFRTGRAAFERLGNGGDCGLDMEVHERVIVDGVVGRLRESLVHEDFKGLRAYLERHNNYSTWEAGVRASREATGVWGKAAIAANLLGNTQERRRYLKGVVSRLPCEPLVWFGYHYLVRLGFLEGRRGLIASQIRAAYISQVRAKMFELRLKEDAERQG